MVHDVHRSTHGKNQKPNHLLYVNVEGGIWQPIFGQLAAFFSNSNDVPVLSFTDPIVTLDTYKQLGNLPLVAHVPAVRGDKFGRIVVDSAVSLIGLIDSGTASLFHGDLRTTFVVPNAEKVPTISVLDPQDLDELRQAFATFVLEFVAHGDTPNAYGTDQFPAWITYVAACKMLDVEPQAAVRSIMQPSFHGQNAGVNTLWDVLHREQVRERSTLCVVVGLPPETNHFTAWHQHIFVDDHIVVISHATIDRLNRAKDAGVLFNIRALTHELKERRLLIDCPEWLSIDTNRCWIISRETWNTKVIRPTLRLLEPVTAGNIIQIRKPA
jgi:hypothetical protein